MRISNAAGPSRLGRKSSIEKSIVPGEFNELLDATQSSENRAVGATTTIATSAPLLAIQEIEDREARRRALLHHGDRMLDLLTEIRNGLLMGGLSENTIQTIQKSLEDRKQSVDDPALTNLIQEIEVRAAVELAKLGLSKADVSEKRD